MKIERKRLSKRLRSKTKIELKFDKVKMRQLVKLKFMSTFHLFL